MNDRFSQYGKSNFLPFLNGIQKVNVNGLEVTLVVSLLYKHSICANCKYMFISTTLFIGLQLGKSKLGGLL